jgi:hypothetical protein
LANAISYLLGQQRRDLRKLCSVFGQRENKEQGEKMKKLVFLSYGFGLPTPEIMDAWGNWFPSIGDKLVDGGNPFGFGREITHTGTKELLQDLGAITG